MNEIEQMLTGNMDMKDFLRLLHTDAIFRDQLRELVPQPAKSNPDHPLWKKISFDSLKRYNFDFYRFLCWLCRFNGSIADNLNVFSAIQRVYTFSHPDIKCTNYYSESFDLYLDVIKDCYDGPEVEEYVEEIMKDALMLPTKGKRKKYAQERVRALFHSEDGMRPRWIQGPEWPGGRSYPMKFCHQKRIGEKVMYYFVDVETGKEKVVTQHF